MIIVRFCAMLYHETRHTARAEMVVVRYLLIYTTISLFSGHFRRCQHQPVSQPAFWIFFTNVSNCSLRRQREQQQQRPKQQQQQAENNNNNSQPNTSAMRQRRDDTMMTMTIIKSRIDNWRCKVYWRCACARRLRIVCWPLSEFFHRNFFAKKCNHLWWRSFRL